MLCLGAQNRANRGKNWHSFCISCQYIKTLMVITDALLWMFKYICSISPRYHRRHNQLKEPRMTNPRWQGIFPAITIKLRADSGRCRPATQPDRQQPSGLPAGLEFAHLLALTNYRVTVSCVKEALATRPVQCQALA